MIITSFAFTSLTQGELAFAAKGKLISRYLPGFILRTTPGPNVLVSSSPFFIRSSHNIGGRTITNLRFADDIDGLAGEEEELANLVERLDKASKAYGMEISAGEDKANDKHHQCHQHRDQSEWTEA